jgi:hypothetical protein
VAGVSAKLTHVSARLLVEQGACEKQVAKFRLAFPRGAAVTPRNLVRAVNAGLNIGWASDLLLGESSHQLLLAQPAAKQDCIGNDQRRRRAWATALAEQLWPGTRLAAWKMRRAK